MISGLDVDNDVPWVQPRPPCWWRRALRSSRALHRRRSTTAGLWRADVGSPAVRSCRSTRKRGRRRATPRASPCRIRVAPAWPGHSRGGSSPVRRDPTDGSRSRTMRSANAFSYGEIDEWLVPRAAGEQKADIRLRRGAARIEMATPVMTIARLRGERSILIAAFLILARITERAADPTMAVTASRKRSAALRGAPFQPRGAQRNRPPSTDAPMLRCSDAPVTQELEHRNPCAETGKRRRADRIDAKICFSKRPATNRSIRHAGMIRGTASRYVFAFTASYKLRP